MRVLPTMGVFQPMDARETELIMDYLVKDWKGPAYLRLTRQNLPDLFPTGAQFKPGKLMEIEPAPNAAVVCIATGASVAEAVEASRILKAAGIAMSVWNAHSLKPYDAAKTVELASGAKFVVTVEDHSVIGGLGSCVAEALAECGRPAGRLVRLGVQDLFGESGEGPELYEKHGISGPTIAERVRKLVKS
jgi:transketolase